jgi:predicted NAD/FAD-binding protein
MKDKAMTDNSQRNTATIYQFPVGGSAALRARREPAKSAVGDLAPVRAPKIAHCGSWYHEEAVLEDAGAALPRQD